MNALCGRWFTALLIGVTGASGAAPVALPGAGKGGYRAPPLAPSPVLPPDTRCRLSISNPVVDYGVMSRWQLQAVAGGRLSPGTRSLTLSVACPYPRAMKLLIEGEGGAQGGLRFGERGLTHLRLLNAQLDGNTVELRALTQAGTLAKHSGQAIALNAGQQVALVVQGRLAEGRTLTAQLEVKPVMSEDGARVSSRRRSESMFRLTLLD